MTSRIEGDPLDHAWRARTAGAATDTIDLGPLRPQEARDLAGALLRRHAALAQRCVERAAGNPLFLEQLLRHAEESAEAGVPGSVQNLVQARMDRLDPVTRRPFRRPRCSASASSRTRCGDLLGRSDYDSARLVRHFLCVRRARSSCSPTR